MIPSTLTLEAALARLNTVEKVSIFKPDVAVVVPCRNRDWDWLALRRLLNSLDQSDFPKSYLLYVPVLTAPQGWDSRENGIIEALKSECKYILVSDNDCHVPPEWWQKSLDIFYSDQEIGAVGYLNHSDDNSKVRPTDRFREIRLRVSKPDSTTLYNFENGVWSEQGLTSLPQPDANEMLWDGFNLFKREFLVVSGVRNTAYNPVQHPNGAVDPVRKLLGDFTHSCTMKTVLANIEIFHDKQVT